MEEGMIKISWLNDFLFCPASIYFHNLMENVEPLYYSSREQTLGKQAHETIDNHHYTTSADVITSLDVQSLSLGIIGKIDYYKISVGLLVERKRHISRIYDGHIFQLYAQAICMEELGYHVNNMECYSYDDNKHYPITHYKDDKEAYQRFLDTLENIRKCDLNIFEPTNSDKCKTCVYSSICDRSLI